jgi:hypothetical protein
MKTRVRILEVTIKKDMCWFIQLAYPAFKSKLKLKLKQKKKQLIFILNYSMVLIYMA